jgi:hypothetical protein
VARVITQTPQRIPQHRRPGPAIQRHHQLLQIPLLPLPPGYPPPPPVPDHRPLLNVNYFGRQDKIAQQLDALTLVVEDPIIQFKDSEKTLPPLITLAPNQGFLTDWHYGSQAG